MLNEKDLGELVKWSTAQHTEGTDTPRTSCPACMTMDKYLAHRAEILALAWGYFGLQRTLERSINPPVILAAGGLNPWPRLHDEISEYIKPNSSKPWWKLWDWNGTTMFVVGIVLGCLLTWLRYAK